MLNLKHPEVRRFSRAAELHFEAAGTLFGELPAKGDSRLGHEVVYLAGYVVECALKALYLSRTPVRKHAETVDWFKSDVKRNLDRLRVELTRKGVVFPKEIRGDLKKVVSRWSSEMRYDSYSWNREAVANVVDAVRQIFGWVQGET